MNVAGGTLTTIFSFRLFLICFLYLAIMKFPVSTLDKYLVANKVAAGAGNRGAGR